MICHDWSRKYLEHLKIFYPNAPVVKTNVWLSRFALSGREGRDSEMGTSIPKSANAASKPAHVSLGRGKAELLPGMDIIKNMDFAVNFGGRPIQCWAVRMGNDDL